MEFIEFIVWAFCGILSGGVFLLVMLLNKLVDEIRKLNSKLAEVVASLAVHDVRITSLEKRNS